MKTQPSRVLGSLAVLGCLAGISHGTTVGFVGATGVNNNMPADYGSNAAADGEGWTTSDGTGATPDVSLNWPAGPGDWEFHNSPNFAVVEALHVGGDWDDNTATTTNAVAQTQAGPLEINFSVPAGIQFVLNSFDIGNATDQRLIEGLYGWNLDLVRDSDSAVVWSHSTPLFGPDDAESVTVDYTGDPGEDYTLNFARHPEVNPDPSPDAITITYRTGIDNLSFSQVPEPSTLALLAVFGLVAVVTKRKR